MTGERPRIGISACLLGEAVRFDAGPKLDAFLVETLGPQVGWVEVCPEVEAGFGTPRDAMRLTLTSHATRARGGRFDTNALSLVVPKTGAEVTGQLRRYAVKKVEALSRARLSAFILKKDSPSCGMERVKVYVTGGMSERGGRGLFAEALIAPAAPAEPAGRG